jgi:integrase/recombinase XerD
MIDRTSLGHWIRRFLLEYAASERNLSPNTCASYRDMLVLLLPYVAKSKGAAVDTLAVADLSAEVVRSFLAHLESERQCSTAGAGIAYKPPCGEIAMCLRVGRMGPIK